jgi:cytochrome c oxidase assembly factor CtaG
VRPDPSSWSLHLAATLPLAVLAAGYALGVRRFATPARRIACFAGGVVLLLAAAVTPLDALTYHLLSAHLLQNVVLAEWAPALLVLGVAPALATELARLPGARLLTQPAIALPLWLATYFVWHVPPLYDAALEEPALLHLEHVCYLAAGVLLWWPVLQDVPRRLPPARRAAYLFAGFLLASPLGLLLALLPEPVYSFYEAGPRFHGIEALTDQQIAGVTMASEQAVVFFAAFAYFFFRFLAEEERADETAPRTAR